MKTTKLILLIGAVVVVMGCDKAKEAKDKKDELKATIAAHEDKLNESVNQIEEHLQEAMNTGKKMKCNYSFVDEDDGEISSKAWIWGDKNKVISTVTGRQEIVVFDGNTFYNWNEGELKGAKMNKDCVDSLPKEGADENGNDADKETFGEFETSEQIIARANGNCKETDEEIDFTVPSNVEFMDTCDLLKKQMELLKNLE